MFQNLPPISIDPLFQLWNEYQADPNPKKQNFGIGIYTDEQGHPYVMPSIQVAAKNIDTTNFNYISMSGDRDFLESTAKLVLGDLFEPGNTALQQACGGTHAIKMHAQLAHQDGYTHCLIPTPTWSNHAVLYRSLKQETFPHLKPDHTINIETYKEALNNASPNSILILQGGPTHNPCGINLSLKDIKTLVPILKEKDVAVCIDFAYLGFGDSIEKDRETVQYLWEHLDKVSVAISFSKNGCLYRQRTGALLVKSDQPEHIESHLQVLIRESISNLPAFGATVMTTCLNTYIDQWKEELNEMKNSTNNRRNQLLSLLPDKYQYLRNTKGMFGILPLKDEDIQTLRDKYGIYLPKNKRINFSGLQTEIIPAVAEALKSLNRKI